MAEVPVRADEKDLKLIGNVRTEVPNNLIGDPGRLRQIIINLVGNAIKFTQQGTVSVRVGVSKRIAHDKVLLHFSIKDTGIGISKDNQNSIFDSFTQVVDTTARKYGGTGLGLSISSQLITLMGGKIWLKSVPGRGSTFHFTVNFEQLPVETRKRETEEQQPSLTTRIAIVRSKKLHILLAEDDAINRTMAIFMIEQAACRVTAVENGKKALQALDDDNFDLVLMDIQMPEMDGVEATVAIREKEKKLGRHIPIIALTAYALKGDRERFLQAGMDDYLSKPIRQEELLAAIEKQIKDNGKF